MSRAISKPKMTAGSSKISRLVGARRQADREPRVALERGSFDQSIFKNSPDVVVATQEHDSGGPADAATQQFRLYLRLQDRLFSAANDLRACKLAGRYVQQVGRLRRIAPPTRRQKIVKLTGVFEATDVG